MTQSSRQIRSTTRPLPVLIALLLVTCLFGCDLEKHSASPSAPETPDSTVQYGYRVLDARPHDPNAYTQGLLYHGGWFYESTGRYGHSTLRQVDPATGEVVLSLPLPSNRFGEGLAMVGDLLIQLTWRGGEAYVYARDGLLPLSTFAYSGSGWGLAYNGEHLIMSDGSDRLLLRDPATFEIVGQLRVHDAQGPVGGLNELEWIEGEIWANLYTTDLIARIDPGTGFVTGLVDLEGLLPEEAYQQGADVLNGIAWDDEGERLYVTGKLWPALYQIEVVAE